LHTKKHIGANGKGRKDEDGTTLDSECGMRRAKKGRRKNDELRSDEASNEREGEANVQRSIAD
jgi:hypothetical protein